MGFLKYNYKKKALEVDMALLTSDKSSAVSKLMLELNVRTKTMPQNHLLYLSMSKRNNIAQSNI